MEKIGKIRYDLMNKCKVRKITADLRAAECSYVEVVGSLWPFGELCEFRLNKMDPTTPAAVEKLSAVK